MYHDLIFDASHANIIMELIFACSSIMFNSLSSYWIFFTISISIYITSSTCELICGYRFDPQIYDVQLWDLTSFVQLVHLSLLGDFLGINLLFRYFKPYYLTNNELSSKKKNIGWVLIEHGIIIKMSYIYLTPNMIPQVFPTIVSCAWELI